LLRGSRWNGLFRVMERYGVMERYKTGGCCL